MSLYCLGSHILRSLIKSICGNLRTNTVNLVILQTISISCPEKWKYFCHRMICQNEDIYTLFNQCLLNCLAKCKKSLLHVSHLIGRSWVWLNCWFTIYAFMRHILCIFHFEDSKKVLRHLKIWWDITLKIQYKNVFNCLLIDERYKLKCFTTSTITKFKGFEYFEPFSYGSWP